MTDVERAVQSGCVWFDRSARQRLFVSGPDRAKFLHNLTTNDVKRLAVGRGQEAFVTSPQGKTIGYLTILALDDRLLVRTDPGGLALVLPHLQKYGVFDEVSIDEASARTFEYHLAGPRSEPLVHELGGTAPGPEDLAHHQTECAGAKVRIVREAPTGRPGLTLIGDLAAASAIRDRFRAEAERPHFVEGDAALFETLRIEAGTPVFGQDVKPENLPQEVGRDAQAINFVKGCYLGQETVARLDALGHVNKLLMGLKFGASNVPPP